MADGESERESPHEYAGTEPGEWRGVNSTADDLIPDGGRDDTGLFQKDSGTPQIVYEARIMMFGFVLGSLMTGGVVWVIFV